MEYNHAVGNQVSMLKPANQAVPVNAGVQRAVKQPAQREGVPNAVGGGNRQGRRQSRAASTPPSRHACLQATVWGKGCRQCGG